MSSKLKTILREGWSFLKRENFLRLFVIVVMMIVISAIAISYFEPGITLDNGLWWSIVTLTTVGYGDISPSTFAGRAIAVVLMLVGIGILGTLSATIASILVDLKMKEDRGLSKYQFKNHIIICEWNSRVEVILQELRADAKTADTAVVLISDNIEQKPVDDKNLFFIRGVVNDNTLRRASLEAARTVLILGDDSLEKTVRDAKVVLTTLTVESMNPAAYSIVELQDEINVQHCRRANADEIIIGSELTSHMIARATLDHGITKVITEVLSAESGNELYKIVVPNELVNQTVLEATTLLKTSYQSTLLAIQTHPKGEVISNPPANQKINRDDFLIVIAANRPEVNVV